MKPLLSILVISSLLTGCGNDREVVTATVTPMQMTGDIYDDMTFDTYLARLNMHAAAASLAVVEPDLYALRIAVREQRWDDARHFIAAIRQRRLGGENNVALPAVIGGHTLSQSSAQEKPSDIPSAPAVVGNASVHDGVSASSSTALPDVKSDPEVANPLPNPPEILPTRQQQTEISAPVLFDVEKPDHPLENVSPVVEPAASVPVNHAPVRIGGKYQKGNQ